MHRCCLHQAPGQAEKASGGWAGHWGPECTQQGDWWVFVISMNAAGTQNPLQSDGNIKSRGKKWEAAIFHVWGKK